MDTRTTAPRRAALGDGAAADMLTAAPPVAARRLLSAVLWSGEVAVRIVEVEAYGGDPDGPWPDPASHSGRGPTPRNTVMYGPAGRLYVYRSYGMHTCVNITTGPNGTAAAVLVRAGEIVAGHELARARRAGCRGTAGPASGPGNLGRALGVTMADYGTSLLDARSPIRLELSDPVAESEIAQGPRVGVSMAADRPWRLWLPSSPAVSGYRRSPRAPAPGVPDIREIR